MGAERLIGRGDMLYSPIDANQPRRLQGAFIPRADLQRLVEYLCSQGEPDFEIIPQAPEDDDDDFAGDLEVSDKLYQAAVEFVVGEGEASVSGLQRRFKIGYARAGRLIDAMEQRGVVGPHVGPKPREVMLGAAAMHDHLSGTAYADESEYEDDFEYEEVAHDDPPLDEPEEADLDDYAQEDDGAEMEEEAPAETL